MIPLLLVLKAAAAPSQPCRGTVNQAELDACEWRVFRSADRALDRQWALTLAAARAADRGRSAQDRGIGYEADLRAAERAWIAYRDAECRVERDRAEGGTIGPVEDAICRRRMTTARAARLAAIARDLGPR